MLERVQRRLAAILAADVVGYSRLIGQDEAGTLRRLKELRHTCVDPTIKEHQGRIVKTTGDGLLIEFPSAVEAVRCAVVVQRELAQNKGSAPTDHQIAFRIGVHQGDVVVDDDDLFGDGINVAARLETLSEPGGICVSLLTLHGKYSSVAVGRKAWGRGIFITTCAGVLRADSKQILGVGVGSSAKFKNARTRRE